MYEQTNGDRMRMPVVFLSRKGTKNVGDNICSPYLYFGKMFPQAQHSEFHLGEWQRYRLYLKTVMSPLLVTSRMLVIGGGGLLGLELFADDLRYWTSAPFCPKVLWGAGHNAHNVLDVDSRDISEFEYACLNRFDKVGIRDWQRGYDWVPCASCMHSELAQSTSEKGGLVAALHYETLADSRFVYDLVHSCADPVDVVLNNSPLEVVMGKLRSASAVVTNSYHAAYWATLMSKRAVLVGGGSKVRMLRHAPAHGSVINWRQKVDEAPTYPHALEECRERNLEYSREVAQLCA
jgi:hypothetical protein